MADSAGVTVSLLIPGLYGFVSQEWQEIQPHLPRLPGLSALLNCGRRTVTTPSDFEFLLAEKFALAAPDPLPVAALTYLYDKNRSPSHYVLRADPVYLKADRDCLYLLGSDGLEVTAQEAVALAAQINRLYEQDGWSLEIGAPDRWYIVTEKKPLIKTSPLHEVFGKSIAGFLPQGQDEKKWRVVLTELQMLLHNSEVNMQRAMDRRLPINSLWVWGEGGLPEPASSETIRIEYVWSNQALCLGLAQWANCPGGDLPPSASEWIEGVKPGRHLVVFDDMRVLAKENFHVWMDKLVCLDEDWFSPLMRAFNTGLLANIRIETENGSVFNLARSNWNKWWRKQRLWYEWA